VRGHQYLIKPPFFVLATQNPIELEGTYPLPEAQLDRFLFNTVLDYLSPDDEMKVVDLTTTTKTAIVDTVTTAEEILDFQQLIRMVPLADSVARYAVETGARHSSHRPHGPRFREELRELWRQRSSHSSVAADASEARALHAQVRRMRRYPRR